MYSRVLLPFENTRWTMDAQSPRDRVRVQGEQTADDMAQLTRLGQLEFDRRRWLALAAASERAPCGGLGLDRRAWAGRRWVGAR